MKKVLVVLIIVFVVLASLFVIGMTGFFGQGTADLLSSMVAKPKCATIQGGTIKTEEGASIATGTDQWGYNYEAHIFNGKYCDSYYNADWCQSYTDNLVMKWNDAWLSSKDCNGDGLLDRHYGMDTYLGSGAWVTNHLTGTYEGENGETCTWSYFFKIVATPRGCQEDGNCYEKDGTLIGRQIWTDFAVTQEVMDDPCGGYEGILYKSDAVGLGQFKP